MSDLTSLRARLDAADELILKAIGARCEVIKEIAEHKRAHQVSMMQPSRITYVRNRYASHADTLEMAPGRLNRIATELIEAACELENRLMAPADER